MKSLIPSVFAFARLTGYGQLPDQPSGAQSSLISVSKLGAEYFIVPNVSFGPALQWRHTFGDFLSPQFAVGRNVYSLVGQFSIYF